MSRKNQALPKQKKRTSTKLGKQFNQGQLTSWRGQSYSRWRIMRHAKTAVVTVLGLDRPNTESVQRILARIPSVLCLLEKTCWSRTPKRRPPKGAYSLWTGCHKIVSTLSRLVDSLLQLCCRKVRRPGGNSEVRRVVFLLIQGSLFERGIASVGMDFASHPLWDKYIEFEKSQEEFKKINSLYTRILSIPLEQISSYWERYKSFIAERSIQDLVTPEEMDQIKKMGIEGTDKQKHHIMLLREKVFQKAAEAANSRRVFELEVLKVNYFHVRPLDEAQLNNWTKYLEFEEKQGDHARIVKLYERCVVPCVCILLKAYILGKLQQILATVHSLLRTPGVRKSKTRKCPWKVLPRSCQRSFQTGMWSVP